MTWKILKMHRKFVHASILITYVDKNSFPLIFRLTYRQKYYIIEMGDMYLRNILKDLKIKEKRVNLRSQNLTTVVNRSCFPFQKGKENFWIIENLYLTDLLPPICILKFDFSALLLQNYGNISEAYHSRISFLDKIRHSSRL